MTTASSRTPAPHDADLTVAGGATGLPPLDVLRLFPGEDPAALVDPRWRSRLIIGLLEDGDRRDLAWLLATVGRDEVRRVLLSPARRRLSPRSQALFSLLFGLPTATADRAAFFWS